MYFNIDIPNNAIKYILFQRTAYLLFPKNPIYRVLNKLSPQPLFNRFVIWESFFRKEKVKQLFNEDMRGEYEQIKNWLPNKCSVILDIGCGVGGIDVLLHRHYHHNPMTEFYLLDKTSVNKNVYYHYEKRGAFYNSLDVAKDLLRQNAISKSQIHLLDVKSDYSIKIPTRVDLVISLISWGFHYPVSTYVDQVYNVMNKGGHLIMDIRKSTEGEKEITNRFAKN
jgi:SAM-dependent methyltransferase